MKLVTKHCFIDQTNQHIRNMKMCTLTTEPKFVETMS